MKRFLLAFLPLLFGHLLLTAQSISNNTSEYDSELGNNQHRSSISPCTELFFSEYIESSGSKALEIYNPTNAPISLNQYQIKRYDDGSASVTSTLSLSGTLIPGNTFVIVNSTSADPTLVAAADLVSAIVNFNGNDAIELYNTSTSSSADIIGEIGVDPITAWSVGSDSTQNVTMVRMSSVSAGNLTWAGGSDLEWNTYGLNEYSYIGSHTTSGCTGPVNPVANAAGSLSFCVGDTVMLINDSYGGTAPYTSQWAVSGIPVSTDDTLLYEATAATTISVTLTITDDNSLMDDTTFNVTIRNNPTAGFSISASMLCPEDTAWITSSVFGPMNNFSYDLTPTTGTIVTSTVTGNGYFTSTTDDTYSITQTLTDSFGCSDTAMHTVTVNPQDDASFTAIADVCDQDTVALSHTNINGTWSGTGVTDLGSGMGQFTSTTIGDHYITYTTGGFCSDTYTDTVEVLASPEASFTFTGSITVDFTDTSTGSPVSYLWDLGDGNTSAQTNPSHTYSADGTYTVCLTVVNANGCEDSICQTISIAGVGVSEIDVLPIVFYPNPASDLVNIQTNEPVQVIICNVIGEQVFHKRINANQTISLADLGAGTYFIQFEKNGKRFTEKLILK